jgi:predicted transposase/invertase (TIGR01784 family)
MAFTRTVKQFSCQYLSIRKKNIFFLLKEEFKMELGYTSLAVYAYALGRELGHELGLEEAREEIREEAYKEAYKKAFEEAYEESCEETRLTITKNLLATGMHVDQITQITGLSEDKILLLSRQE